MGKKKALMVGIVVAAVALATGFTLPALAQGPEKSPDTTANWQAMHDACVNGDWAAMQKAAQEAHGDNLDNTPCHGQDDQPQPGNQTTNPGSGMMGGWNGGGMMGGGWNGGGTGGMMGSGGMMSW